MATHPDLLAEGDAKEQVGNFDAARRLFERGGKLGQHYCWSRLAYMYDVGIGVRVDKAKAMSYYRRSWRKGEWVGATNIAILYREAGKRRAAFRWFLRAAEAGDGDFFVEVAKCYRLGMGVRKNHVLARQALDGATASDRITEGGREKRLRSCWPDFKAEALINNPIKAEIKIFAALPRPMASMGYSMQKSGAQGSLSALSRPSLLGTKLPI